MSKTRATQAADIYSTARENPYVQRLIEDDELRDNLRMPSMRRATPTAARPATARGRSRR